MPRNSIDDGLTLSDFMRPKHIGEIKKDEIRKSTTHENRAVFVETYGKFATVYMGDCYFNVCRDREEVVPEDSL
jgi:hypothetical protein